MPSTVIATCGTSLNGIHNILFAHLIKGNHRIKKIILLGTSRIKGDFMEDLISLISQTNSTKMWKLPIPSLKEINGENLILIAEEITKILNEHDSFILDITAGRKIMAVGAAMAFERANSKDKTISYYLLKGDTNAPATDRLIQHLLKDEWDLTYY